MPGRAKDWMRQAERDIEVARNNAAEGYFEWTCFTAHQGAEKALKAAYQHLGGEARGHDLVSLLQGIASRVSVPGSLMDDAAELGKHYIGTRYPNAHVEGPPFRHYTKAEADRAIRHAETILGLDRNAVLESLKRAVRRLTRVRPEITEVVLSGSIARGDAVPGSDADLVIVLSESDLPFLDRIPRYRLSGMPVGVDMFPYTEKELTAMLTSGSSFVNEALSKGSVIYRRRSAGRQHREVK